MMIRKLLESMVRPFRKHNAHLSTILFDPEILIRVLTHFEQRKKTWEMRGSDRPYHIGHYFEFGCYDGDTLLDFFTALRFIFGSTLPSYWRIYGFDSFEGLPASNLLEDIHPYAGEGSYRSTGVEFVRQRLIHAGCHAQRISLTPGFFEKSLTNDLREQLIGEGAFASFVNIDCDYYSSTTTVLNWLEPLLVDGSIIYFDDIYFYNCNPGKGELRAIGEFNESRVDSGIAVAPYFDRGNRCYMYWRNEAMEPHRFDFKQYVTG